ncbi:MAG: YkgJ family cysteine cluster protein [FCB group bacterium]|nr:YkgJ family cysteine cluster protein [FCB group bacterium]
MTCRPGCGACCIAISISSPIPGMPEGKPARVRCLNLKTDHTCSIYGQDNYPAVCANFKPDPLVCGRDFTEAMYELGRLEKETEPAAVDRREGVRG